MSILKCQLSGINPASGDGDAEAQPSELSSASGELCGIGCCCLKCEVSTLDCGIDPVGAPSLTALQNHMLVFLDIVSSIGFADCSALCFLHFCML